MVRNCPFCVLKPNEIVIWRDDKWIAIFEPFPVAPGHALVFPVRHVPDLKGLSREEWTDLKNAIDRVIEGILSEDLRKVYKRFLENPFNDNSIWFCTQALKHPRINTKPDAYNHGVNDGRAAGRTVDHLHWHVIPRYEGDMDDPRGGVRYVIPEMGNYKKERK